MKRRNGKDENWSFMTSIIGLDLWNKRVWIAISEQWIAFPHSIIPRVEIIKILKKLIQEKKTQMIVVGLPYDLYWVDTKQLDKTQKFIEKLWSIFPKLEIVWYDERFSSFVSEQTLIQAWKNSQSQYKDDIAACLILESYLATR